MRIKANEKQNERLPKTKQSKKPLETCMCKRYDISAYAILKTRIYKIQTQYNTKIYIIKKYQELQ